MKVPTWNINGPEYILNVDPLEKLFEDSTATIKVYMDDLARISKLQNWFSKSPERQAWLVDDKISTLFVYSTFLQIYLSAEADSSFIADAVRIFKTEFTKSASYDKASINLQAEVDPKLFFGISTIQFHGYKPASCSLVTYREPVSEERKAALLEELELGTLKSKLDCGGEKKSAPDANSELDGLIAVNSSPETNSLDSDLPF